MDISMVRYKSLVFKGEYLFPSASSRLAIAWVLILFIGSTKLRAQTAPILHYSQLHQRIIKAIETNNITNFKELIISHRTKINQRDPDALNWLFWVIRYRRQEMFNFLLQNKIDVNYSHPKYGTALIQAIYQEQPILVKRLVQYRAKLNIRARQGFIFSSNTHWVAPHSSTPLLLAISLGQQEIVNILLTHGAKPNLTDADGFTPLMSATCRNDLNLMQILISKGASVNMKDATGSTAFVWGCFYGNLDGLEMLLKRKANPYVVTKEGKTALMVACQEGNWKIVEWLLRYGIPVNQTDVAFNTALHFACDVGDIDTFDGGIERSAIDIVHLLLEAGANPNIKNKHGQTPLSIAKGRNRKEIVSLLLERE